MSPIRVLIIDDHPIVRQGIKSLLSNYAEFEVVGEAGNKATALQCIQAHPLDVILLDISLPQESGLDILPQICQSQPDAKVLVLTSYDDDEYIMRALQLGAQGFILKSVSDEMLVSAIHAVYQGERTLSPQVTEQVVRKLVSKSAPADTNNAPSLDTEDQQILHLLAEGASNNDIAAALYMSNTTVKRKLRHIFTEMNVQTRAQAAAEAVRRGLV